MTTVGRSTLLAIRQLLSNNDVAATDWDKHARAIGYVSLATEETVALAERDNVLRSPFAVFFWLNTSLNIITLRMYIPTGEDANIPASWGNGYNLNNDTAIFLNQQIEAGNIMSVFYQVPRGMIADRNMVPKADGVMFYARDERTLYMYDDSAISVNKWVPIAEPADILDIGIMVGYPDPRDNNDEHLLPLPSNKFKYCDGSTLPIADYEDLYNILTNNDSIYPYETNATKPTTNFRLPNISNTIIKVQ